MTYQSSLYPGIFYHIYNRGVNRENIFFEGRNYHHFLRLYIRYISPVADISAYCLLKNHFHLLIRMKDAEDPKEFNKSSGSIAFSNFFNAYAKAINNAYGRTGSLFQHPFGRIPITSQTYLVQIVRYIHFNAQKHHLTKDFRDWKYSSYRTLTSNQSTKLLREEVLCWFDGKEGFIASHEMENAEMAVSTFAPGDFDC
jgi:putative transposase